MIREIKFRAWDEKRGTLAQVTDIGWDDDWIEVEDYNICLPLSKTTIEQYTGLKDKNGKKIYEGDIVQTNYMNAKGWVVWADGAWDICLAGHSFELFLAEEVGVGCEVIGNIHENPELLGGEG